MGGGAGTKDFLYDTNSNEIRMVTPLSLLYQRYDGANRLFNMKDDATGAATYLTYDGRNFLTQARQGLTTCCSPVLTQSVYSSEGALQGRSVRNILGGTLTKDTKVRRVRAVREGLERGTGGGGVFVVPGAVGGWGVGGGSTY
jgi:hypothetical protein